MRVFDVAPARFDDLVRNALDGIPEDLARLIDNVVVLVEEEPPEGGAVLLGLYSGVPLTARGDSYSGVLPDTITIFRTPILAICWSDEDVVREVRTTVVHEVAHHFGIDDDRLDELGY